MGTRNLYPQLLGQGVFEGENDHWWDGHIHGQTAAKGVHHYTVIARNRFGPKQDFNSSSDADPLLIENW